MARPPKYTPEQVAKMAQLYERGIGFKAIGARFGCSGSYAARLVREHGQRKEAAGVQPK